LLEHYAGNLPAWLSPKQVSILPISDKYLPYAQKLVDLMKINDIRALLDDRNEKIGKKIRDAEMKKIPYMLVIGENEMQDMEAMAGYMAFQQQSEVMDEAAIKRALFKAARVGNVKEF
jgi:threonyl-tRNA synthetase